MGFCIASIQRRYNQLRKQKISRSSTRMEVQVFDMWLGRSNQFSLYQSQFTLIYLTMHQFSTLWDYLPPIQQVKVESMLDILVHAWKGIVFQEEFRDLQFSSCYSLIKIVVSEKRGLGHDRYNHKGFKSKWRLKFSTKWNRLYVISRDSYNIMKPG